MKTKAVVTRDDFARYVLEAGYSFPLDPATWRKLAEASGYERPWESVDTRSKEHRALDEDIERINHEIRAAYQELSAAGAAAKGGDLYLVREDGSVIEQAPPSDAEEARVVAARARVVELEREHQAAVSCRSRLLADEAKAQRKREGRAKAA